MRLFAGDFSCRLLSGPWIMASFPVWHQQSPAPALKASDICIHEVFHPTQPQHNPAQRNPMKESFCWESGIRVTQPEYKRLLTLDPTRGTWGGGGDCTAPQYHVSIGQPVPRLKTSSFPTRNCIPSRYCITVILHPTPSSASHPQYCIPPQVPHSILSTTSSPPWVSHPPQYYISSEVMHLLIPHHTWTHLVWSRLRI